LCVWPFASVMLQARSRLHVRRPGSCQPHVFSYGLQVLFKLSVSCCHRPGPGCTGGMRAKVCTLHKTVLHACLSDLASMSLQLSDTMVLQQCKACEFSHVRVSTLQAFMYAKWQPYTMNGIAHNVRDAVVILTCVFSNKHHSQLPAGLCQQVCAVPAALAEPEAEASVHAEVGYVILCLIKMLRVSHTAPHILC